MDDEALFSLELAVETVTLNNEIVCRFPAIAFRLLDFPTLVIYHVEHELAVAIKHKIEGDPVYDIPNQLRELQDSNGDYFVQRGKSCLFKLSPSLLANHLENTPLYVMVLDTFPKIPKLIGSCCIPLNDTCARIMMDIHKHSISIPAVHGERGQYKVFNLMGIQIGSMSFGYRLLSLGVGLIPHIPDKSIARIGKQKVAELSRLDCRNHVSSHDAIAQTILRDVEAADKVTQVALTPAAVATESQLTQTLLGKGISLGVQTDKATKKNSIIHQRRLPLSKRTINENDIEFNHADIACPPPLFYNSNAPEPHTADNLQFSVYPMKYNSSSGGYFTEFGDSQPEDPLSFNVEDLSEDDTIRIEDRLDDDVDYRVDFQSSRITQTDASNAKSSNVKLHYASVSGIEPAGGISGDSIPLSAFTKSETMGQFPMLNALVNEIMALRGQAGIVHKTRPSNVKTRHHERRPPLQPRSEERQSSYDQSVLSNRSGIKSATSQASISTQKMVTSTKNVGDKSYVAVKKKKLTHGMTNTQRLRLAKVQPGLLEELEKREASRVCEYRAERRRQGKGFYTGTPQMMATVSKSPDTAVSASGDTGVNSSITDAGAGSKSRPVPAPRRSLTTPTMSQNSVSFSEVPEAWQERPEAWKERPGSEASQAVPSPREELPSEASTAESSHSEVTPSATPEKLKILKASSAPLLPTSSLPQDSLHIDDSLDQGGSATKSVMGQTRTLQNPIFPLHSRSYPSLAMASENSETFPDNFTGNSLIASSAEELGFQKYVNHFSDDSTSGTETDERSLAISEDVVDARHPSSHGSGAEPSLRKIIDQYSDDTESALSDNYHSEKTSSDRNKPHLMQKSNFSATSTGVLHFPNLSKQVPLSSSRNPIVAVKQSTYLSRDNVVRSSTLAATESGESTAYISRSQVLLTDTTTSVESAGSDSAPPRVRASPRPSPRPPTSPRPSPSPRFPVMRSRLSSVHTESVSSYAPSEENMSPRALSRLESISDYSDDFESEEDVGFGKKKFMKDLPITDQAKMGYTWS